MTSRPSEPPPPYQSSTPRYSSSTNLNQSTVKLYSNTKERETYENLADLFSIVKSVEHLEKAFIRDSISAADYTPACMKLIAQFKTAQHLIRDSPSSSSSSSSSSNHSDDLARFAEEYRLDCKVAVDRLNKGYPATTEHAVTHSDTPATKNVAETVQHFITAMDSVKLNLVSVDAIHPLLNDVAESLNKNTFLPPDFDGKTKMKNWLTILNKMRASDELNEEQVRQLLFDLESSYNAFYKCIS